MRRRRLQRLEAARDEMDTRLALLENHLQQQARSAGTIARVVRLHMKKGPTVEGVLYHQDERHYMLHGARLLNGTGPGAAVELDGKTWWPRVDVFHVQEVEA